MCFSNPNPTQSSSNLSLYLSYHQPTWSMKPIAHYKEGEEDIRINTLMCITIVKFGEIFKFTHISIKIFHH